MDSILHYTSVSHAGSLMAGINRLRITADLCDVTVVVGDYRILAHKIILSASSPFFYQMLKINTSPETSSCSEVLLESVDAIAALKIIEFCYTSAISLDDETVWPLFEAAIKFQFAEICSLCCEFLTAGLDVTNCILSLRLATRLHFSQLEENCAKYLVDNLQKVSESQSLVSLSAQELSSVLSILEFHQINIEVTATLTQAWLDWDRKSRADFVPKLKLLLPALGDLVDRRFHDGGNIVLEQASMSLADENDKRASKECEDPLLQTVHHDKSSSFSTWICTESRTVETACHSSPKSASESQADDNGKGSSINTSNSLGDNEEGNAFIEPKDFICVSCGDEFECHEDLTVHGRQCDESINIVKSVDGKDAQSLSTGSCPEQNSGKEIEDAFESKSVDTMPVINLKSSQLNDTISENKVEDSVEPSYPKTRRSLRNRKLNKKNVDVVEEKSLSHNGENSLLGSEENRAEEDISIQKDEKFMEKDTIEQGKEDEDLDGRSSGGKGETGIKIGVTEGHNCDTVHEIIRQQVSSVNDSNNNDVLIHGSGSSHEATNSISKSKNIIVNTSENVVVPNEMSPFRDPALLSIEGENSHKKMKDDASDSKGFSTLRQWRQEYQRAPFGIPFKESTPKHKCLICSRGFWDRKALANHWRHNHGVRSVANEEEENVHSDQEIDQQGKVIEQNLRDSSKRKSHSPKNAYLTSPNLSGISGSGMCNLGSGITKSDQGTNTSFVLNSNTDLINDLHANHGERCIYEIQKVKEEILDGKGNSFCPESSVSHKLVHDKDHLSQQKASVIEGGQINPFENVNNDASLSLNPSMEYWMRGALLSQENNENTEHGRDSPSTKASQNVKSTTDFLSNYFHQYNKFAEWCMAQGTQFCPTCLSYHPLGKLCPKAAAQNCSDMNNDASRRKYDLKEKDSNGVSVSKGDEEEEGPLDMSKSSVDYSLRQLTPTTTGSSSKSSSANSSGHSSILGVPPFFNFSNALDMSTPRFGDSSQTGSLALPLRRSPLDPNSSFGPHFTSYHPPFSTASSHPSPNAGPSSSISPNLSTPMTSLPKSSTLNGKKAASRRGFSCTVCNRLFSYQTALFTHMHTHSPSARSYRCQLCNETFARAPDLKVHVCPNGLEKPYSCPSCGQTFAKNIHLKRHLATHSGLKPYPCWVCGKRFSRSDHLKRHTQSIHAGARPHVCQVCGKEFVRKYELNKHMQSHEQSFAAA